PTLDEKAWRATEPHTPNPRARLEAVGELNRAGIPTSVLIAPLMPGINDAPEQVAKIVELATEAGATSIGGNTLFLRGSVRTVFFDWLREHRPDLLPRYEELYRRGAYLPEAQRRDIERAAGAPWAGRGYQQRWKHRVLERRRTLEREARERAAETLFSAMAPSSASSASAWPISFRRLRTMRRIVEKSSTIRNFIGVDMQASVGAVGAEMGRKRGG
ncbi:MAG TPA: hypothetical protein VHN20_09405, partial [Beijerinckiaceae bacterium]|nr:hypothetical protein [Beijerinckiaceae bacterium]